MSRLPDATAPFGWKRAAELGLSFRRTTDDDLEFLARVHAASRTDEFAVAPFPEAQKAGFVAMQFHLQHMHFRNQYPNADWLVTMRGGEDVGRLYLDRWPDQHRLIDIAFLPEHRGTGAGEALLRDLMDEAAAAGKPLTVHVEKHKRAMWLCRRLGFTVAQDEGAYDLMRWTPPRRRAQLRIAR